MPNQQITFNPPQSVVSMQNTLTQIPIALTTNTCTSTNILVGGVTIINSPSRVFPTL